MREPRLILASASPRRAELLRRAGYEFLIRPTELNEEEHPPGLEPAALAEFLAGAKARTGAERFPDHVVLAADTVVALGARALGKPTDAADARRMLESLSGTAHAVITAVAVRCQADGLSRQQVVISMVQMRRLTSQEIERYVVSEQWQGKAGAYGIQDHDPFVMRISGSESNIVGLPMEATTIMLDEAGIRPMGRQADR